MRLQLIAVLLLATAAQADDVAEVSTTLFAEKRDGGSGRLTVIHPQMLFGVDLGQYTTLDFAYSADVVSGATASIYQVDAVSAATSFSAKLLASSVTETWEKRLQKDFQVLESK